MQTVTNIIIIITNSFIITAVMTNMLLFPLRFRSKFLLYIFLILGQCLFSTYGQLITILCISGGLIIIAVSESHRTLNITLAAFGYMLHVFINHLVTIPLNIMGVSIHMLSDNPSYNLPFILIYGLFSFFSTYLLGRYLRTTLASYVDSLPKNILLLFMVEVLASTIVFVANIIRGEIYGYSPQVIYYNSVMFGIFFSLTILIFFLCIYIMKKNNELLRIQKEDEALLQYMHKLEKMYNEMRLFKHDYINILSTMNHYIMEEDTKSLKKYFQTQIFPDSEKLTHKDMVLAKLSNIKVRELKGILYSKMVTAVNCNLSISLEVYDEIDTLAMQTLDLCKVIGIFLDNAIEAAEASAEKQIIFALIPGEMHTAIVISNSTNIDKLNLQKINTREYTSKLGHSGLGLFSAKEILNKYDNVTHSTAFRNYSFTQTIHIMNN